MGHLSERQQLFTRMVGVLIRFALNQPGYALTFGEVYRPAEVAAIYAKAGKGVIDSQHTDRLAVDFNLFIDGQYQTDTAAYTVLGEFWESIGGTWGGRFKRRDGNHFELKD